MPAVIPAIAARANRVRRVVSVRWGDRSEFVVIAILVGVSGAR